MRSFISVAFCLVLLLAIVGAQPANNQRPNEEYRACGSACPDTCASIKQKPGMCVAQCISGWFCKSGYVRNAAGKCVLRSQCP
ncbi:chymotrypsin inhibitor-like [Aedes albopictus]|uniref:TIL domain-containing protein n=1 Tax=Aedes albopictus TaxID=7160 RepID=A0ABM1ZKH2_AEDAL